MIGRLYEQVALIDTSAAIALYDSNDQFHKEAIDFFSSSDFVWFTVNTTAHELFTRVRYDKGLLPALNRYDFLRNSPFNILEFGPEDEGHARTILEKYHEHELSFHDALLRVVMLRNHIYKIFSFDRHFWVLGLEVMPGRTN